MDALADRLRAVLAARSGVRLAYLFGSAARGTLRESSDVDVAVRFAREPTLEERDELQGVLEHAVGRCVDLVDLDQAPPLLLREVIVHGRLLVARADAERVDFETRALLRFMDTAHLRRVQAEYLHAWAEAYRAGQR